MKDSLKKYIDEHRDEFDSMEVPEGSFDNIMAKLNPEKTIDETIKPLFPVKKWLAAASVVILISAGIFTFWNQKTEQTMLVKQSKTKENSNSENVNYNNLDIPEPRKIDLQEVKNENQKLAQNAQKPVDKIPNKPNSRTNSDSEKQSSDKEKALELMNNSFSASKRLEGIALIKNQEKYDNEIIDYLSEKALSDENTNVRLAAVEALEKHSKNSNIEKQMQNIFLQQDDPMVQRELIAILGQKKSSQHNASVDAKLKELTTNPTTLDFVKDEAYAVLLRY
ncbi:HEAT repeat domain-containing protein [Chryseobacterium oryzae]|uniref:HEAT repeat domain-containing protein n=1 Tax=Chryseobacterium oryzae TaxID=2929799 RepID=A0ABY4BJP5_9FLAO|nr:HEAT repeat domain-containing protein [Chryseobacterium oryzae]UOE39129.1 HEAT repeat domain-containing protein [Chryseobacterium oryzae]